MMILIGTLTLAFILVAWVAGYFAGYATGRQEMAARTPELDNVKFWHQECRRLSKLLGVPCA